jgi:protoporphyrinogen oxidase
MKIAIIGAGFAGMAAAYDLSQYQDLKIDIYELDQRVGGMAAGFKEKNWQWSLEDHYHHVFDTDQDFRTFVQDLGFANLLIYKKTKSGTLYHGKIHRLDSALSLLRFSEISLWSRLRTGAVLAFLKLLPQGVLLESFTAAEFLPKTMGKEAWKVIWKPLFVSKFGKHYKEINMAWFWARVHPRGQYLGYVSGGFQNLSQKTAAVLRQRGVKIHLQQRLDAIQKLDKGFRLQLSDLRSAQGKKITKEYDQVIITLPSTILRKLLPQLPDAQQPQLKGLAAMTMLLRLKEPLIQDGSYWLNVNEKGWPFVAVVEHDNLMDKKHYGGESLVYLGRYLPAEDEDFKKDAKQLLRDYEPYLLKLNKNFKKILIEASLRKNAFAQPITFRNYQQFLPKYETGWPGFYWISLQHVYPFDRGINHAIRIGRDLAKKIAQAEGLRRS